MISSEEYIYSNENKLGWIISRIITAAENFITSYVKMSNGNNLPNHNDNDSGDEVDSSDGKCKI
jgi:hypothetical protein